MADPLVVWLDEVSRKHGLSNSPPASGGAEKDAEKDLEAEYRKLGGDGALDQVLAQEDKLFRADTETLRAHVKAWQKERLRALDEHKHAVEGVLRDETTLQAPIKAWLEREKPVATQVTAAVKALGPKLATERGKEVLNEVNGHNEQIREVEIAIEFNERSFVVHRSLRETLDKRYADVDRVYEAFEKIVRDARTELDNALQKKAMSLKDKVAFLRAKPEFVAKRLEEAKESLEQITENSIAGTLKEQPEFEKRSKVSDPPAIDWDKLEAKLDAVKAASLDDLKKDDPALAKLRREYEKAGGDKALFAKRVEAWKKEVKEREEKNKRSTDIYEKMADELQENVAKATRNHERNEEHLRDLKKRLGEITPRLEELAGKAELSPEEDAEQQLLVRESKRVRTDLANRETAAKASAESKKNAEELVEQERRRYEVVTDDDPRSGLVQKPQSSDIHSMPLKAKHAELTGK